MRNENIIELLKYIEGMDGKVSIFNIGEHSFNYNQLKALQIKLLNSDKVFEQFGIIVKENLSIRRALIVLLQEKYYPLKTYDEIDINLEQLIKLAKVRFKFEEFDKILSLNGVYFYWFIGDENTKYLDFRKLSIKLLETFKL